MIKVTDTITIYDSDIDFDFIRASGPGGQNVNKVASAVQLRFNINSNSITDDVRKRLIEIGGSRITKDGVIIIDASQYRSQDRNRQDAIERLVTLIREAAEKPKERKQTKPSRESKQRRLENKRRKSEKKKLRGNVPFPD